ncbi:hypothetical protein P170DRAFT_473586 [Aspergillus steynii IBT 23096]|uniref:Uncharacterized protein n=1 Tax=Aspergillus steynii IBT 23096 TaxID=1392250 RepID=A0A2I2GAV7_9EURO|nr:uncharacterized protein P170DRAFT_473586 [Aspergillus steynii IBT 23096]PLB50012.1 hypothetical protein P170DRAFT_473586 [Aspergillus steynii IBT 23096]
MPDPLNKLRRFIAGEKDPQPTVMPGTVQQKDRDRCKQLTEDGLEFEKDSCFRVIMYTTIPDRDMENPCKMASGLQAKMIQGSWGHKEEAMMRPGWQCLKITFDLRALDHYDTNSAKICLALWRLFGECHMQCLREESNDWEEDRTVSKSIKGRTRVVVRVEKWSEKSGFHLRFRRPE